MKNKTKIKLVVISAVASMGLLTGCTQTESTVGGAGAGALIGSLAGYALGGPGNPGAVLAGAGVGALAGGVAGHCMNQ